MNARLPNCCALGDENATEDIALKYTWSVIVLSMLLYVVLFANECVMSARNRLGIEHTTKMVAICTSTSASVFKIK